MMVSSGKDGKAYQMEMKKGEPGYAVIPRPRLLPVTGTQLTISHLLSGIRTLNGEKIQRYLASDLGDVYMELYLSVKKVENCISLFRSGTRVLPDITVLDIFQCEPWTSGYFQGVIDVPFLHLTPGTRDGIIHDELFAGFCDSLINLKERLNLIAAEQSKAEEERMSKSILRSVQKAILDAMLILPEEEYDWFDVSGKTKSGALSAKNTEDFALTIEEAKNSGKKQAAQKEFFEVAGPLFSVRIQPGSAIVPINSTKTFRAVGLDRSRRQIEQNLLYEWSIIEGGGGLDKKKESSLSLALRLIRWKAQPDRSGALVTMKNEILS